MTRRQLLYGLFLYALSPSSAFANKKIEVLAATYPVYLLSLPLCEGLSNIELSLLVKAQLGCPHDYPMTTHDMFLLSSCQALLINGGGFEGFLHQPILRLNLKNVINAGTDIAPKEEEEHQHHHHGHGHDDAFNPHYFSSPKQAVRMVENLKKGLVALCSAESAQLTKNAEAFQARLSALAEEQKTLGELAQGKALILQHDALSWFCQDAGIQVAHILNEGDGQTASPALLAPLVQKLKAEKEKYFFVAEPQFSKRLVTTLSGETGVPILEIDSLASGPEHPSVNYYEQAIKKNIEVLKSALQKPAQS